MHCGALLIVLQQPRRRRHACAEALSRQHQHPGLISLPPALKSTLPRLLIMPLLRSLLLPLSLAHFENSCPGIRLSSKQATSKPKRGRMTAIKDALTTGRAPNPCLCTPATAQLGSRDSLKGREGKRTPALPPKIGGCASRAAQNLPRAPSSRHPTTHKTASKQRAEPVTLETDTAD